jgi:hypothetical protein
MEDYNFTPEATIRKLKGEKEDEEEYDEAYKAQFERE